MVCGMAGTDALIIATAVGVIAVMLSGMWTDLKINKMLKMVKKADKGSEPK